MPYKNPAQNKEYCKRYFKLNKEKYAYSKKLNYWRNKARKLGEAENIIITLSITELQKLCAEHLN